MHSAGRGIGEEQTIDYVFRLIDIPIINYIIALAICSVVWLISKKPALGLIVGYVFLIVAETLLIRKPFEGRHFQPELFWSWRVWNVQREQILINVLMFIPVGILNGLLWKWRGLCFAYGMSIIIEMLQLLTSRGLCEFDDILHNMIGAAIGVSIIVLINRFYKVGESE